MRASVAVKREDLVLPAEDVKVVLSVRYVSRVVLRGVLTRQGVPLELCFSKQLFFAAAHFSDENNLCAVDLGKKAGKTDWLDFMKLHTKDLLVNGSAVRPNAVVQARRSGRRPRREPRSAQRFEASLATTC